MSFTSQAGSLEPAIAPGPAPHLAAALQSQRNGCRAVHGGEQHVSEALGLLGPIVGGPRVLRGSLEVVDRRAGGAGPEAELPREPERAGEPGLVAELLEDAHGFGELIANRIVAGELVPEQPKVGQRDGGVRGKSSIARRAPCLQRLRENRICPIPLARVLQRTTETGQKTVPARVLRG